MHYFISLITTLIIINAEANQNTAPVLPLTDLHNKIKSDLLPSQTDLNLNHKYYVKPLKTRDRNGHSSIYAFYNSKKQVNQIRIEQYICRSNNMSLNKDFLQNSFIKLVSTTSEKIFNHSPYKIKKSILKNIELSSKKNLRTMYFNKKVRLSHSYYKCDGTGSSGYSIDFFLNSTK